MGSLVTRSAGRPRPGGLRHTTGEPCARRQSGAHLSAPTRSGTERTIRLLPWPEAEPLPASTAPLIGWLTRTEHSEAARGRSVRSKRHQDR